MENQEAQRLALASQKQLKARIEAYTKTTFPEGENPFKYEPLYQFFLNLKIPKNPDLGLVTPPCLTHDRFEALAKEFGQNYQYKFDKEVRQFDIYPRGLILSERLKEDFRGYRHRYSPENIKRRTKREIVRIDRDIARFITKIAEMMNIKFRIGDNIFYSEAEYYQLLTDENSKASIKSLIKARKLGEEPYFPVFRCNYLNKICQDGQFIDSEERELKTNGKTLLVILPEMPQKILEPIVKREMNRLGLT